MPIIPTKITHIFALCNPHDPSSCYLILLSLQLLLKKPGGTQYCIHLNKIIVNTYFLSIHPRSQPESKTHLQRTFLILFTCICFSFHVCTNVKSSLYDFYFQFRDFFRLYCFYPCVCVSVFFFCPAHNHMCLIFLH